MDVEFHYYITYLLAVKAGFPSDRAYKIAYSSQLVDDNIHKIKITDEKLKVMYGNCPTQINFINTSKERDKLLLSHHFLPGDNKDIPLLTTVNSSLARYMLQYALDSDNDYMIGIASHSYVDTWAHQNFIGCCHSYNSMPGVLEALVPNIGHADAGNKPDSIDSCWTDYRLGDGLCVINKHRFTEAAYNLYLHYIKHLKGRDNCCKLDFLQEINLMFGASKDGNGLDPKEQRNKRYNEYACKISGQYIPKYCFNLWLDEIVKLDVNFQISNKYIWKNRDNFVNSNWYHFQEAVKRFQKKIWPIIEKKYEERWLA